MQEIGRKSQRRDSTYAKTRGNKNPAFIFILDALYFLLLSRVCTPQDPNISLLAPLGARGFRFPFPAFSRNTASSANRSGVGRVNRHVMHRNQNREPSGRGSATQQLKLVSADMHKGDSSRNLYLLISFINFSSIFLP